MMNASECTLHSCNTVLVIFNTRQTRCCGVNTILDDTANSPSKGNLQNLHKRKNPTKNKNAKSVKEAGVDVIELLCHVYCQTTVDEAFKIVV